MRQEEQEEKLKGRFCKKEVFRHRCEATSRKRKIEGKKPGEKAREKGKISGRIFHGMVGNHVKQEGEYSGILGDSRQNWGNPPGGIY